MLLFLSPHTRIFWDEDCHNVLVLDYTSSSQYSNVVGERERIKSNVSIKARAWL